MHQDLTPLKVHEMRSRLQQIRQRSIIMDLKDQRRVLVVKDRQRPIQTYQEPFCPNKMVKILKFLTQKVRYFRIKRAKI